MKNLTILAIASVLLLIAANSASARLDFMDPAVCIAGQWLVVNAASESAIEIRVPEDTRYGKYGGCRDKAPAPPFVTNVVTEKGGGHKITVTITDASQASTPNVIVTYGSDFQKQYNSGKGQMKFRFSLDGDD